MKWYHSLFFKITLIFSIAFVGLVVVGTSFTLHQKKEQFYDVRRFAQSLFRSAYSPQTGQLDTALLAQEGFVTVKNTAPLEAIFQNLPPPPLRRQGEMGRRMFPVEIVEFEGEVYALAYLKERPVQVFQVPFRPSPLLHVSLFVLIGVALVFLYVLTLRSIRPLVPLKARIEALAEGDYTLPPRSHSKDEIGALANAFHDTVLKIKDLKEARQLFLRNIMHELKTPITKGKLALAMLEDTSYKAKLSTLFETQEHLLEEFARIEKLGAGELTLVPKPYHIDDIMAQVRDLLPDENAPVDVSVDPQTLHVDFDLFCVALKNMVDNALRYSTDGRACLTCKGETLSISNHGDPLPHPLDSYAQPYFLGGSKQKESRGLGFGLYIALAVFRLHALPCHYTHEAGVSTFTLELTPVL
ncbi:MAG: HAMP domain-containing histidine kinase [Campylobacterales bacterium]|nr:HAMP domain-containing histidine kinase [Campylobacterales bacterium]